MAKKIVKYDVLIKSTKQTKQFDIPKIYTNDLNSVVFQFVVSDLTVEEQATATAITMIYMRDGSFFQNPPVDVEKVGNAFSYTLKENEGNHAGIAKIQLVVTIPGTPAVEYASQLYEFEILNGLETKVAQEVMIYDWTTLTRDAQAYIDQFNLNETTRQTQFTDTQTARTATFDQSETDRTTAFNTAEDGRTTAESGRVTAESGRTTAESNRVTAENNRVTAESGRVTAESGRVTAENARATTFAGYDTRITGMETDVNANGTNLVKNGDFSTGINEWGSVFSTISASNNVLSVTGDGASSLARASQSLNVPSTASQKVYGRMIARVTNGSCLMIKLEDKGSSPLQAFSTILNPIQNQWYSMSGVITYPSSNANILIYPQHQYVDAATANGKTLEIKNVLTIDLTATFGKGNEPTTEQMDALLARFPNSWFNGTANLFQSKQALTKQIALDARTEFEAKNLLKNGGMETDSNSDGAVDDIYTFGYYTPILSADTTIKVDGTKSQKVTGTAQNTRSGMGLIGTAIAGRKYYLTGQFRWDALPNSSSNVITVIDGTVVQTGLNVIIDSELINTWYRYSCIYTPTTTTVGLLINSLALGINYWMDNFSFIDLTAAFGAGKEPTLAEMDRLMARFPNSWFDGVKPIQTIETLYQEKANKVQEAWITPTFTNGWTEISGCPVRYMKDEMGFVHLKGGMVGGTSNGFTLPVGYRPSTDLRLGNSSPAYAFATTVVKGSTGVVYPSGYLDGITFKAEV